MTRVFVSSVVGGLEDERASLRATIESLDCAPVMCEDFQAVNKEPRAACLDELDRCDVYVGLFGEKYGWSAASGQSPTHEEYARAKAMGMPRLIFVADGQREPAQQELIESIGRYEDGRLYRKFSNLAELAEVARTSLRRLLQDKATAESTDTDAAALVTQSLAEESTEVGRRNQDEPVFRLAVCPANQAHDVFPLSLLENAKWKKKIEQRLLFHGDNPVFQTDSPTFSDDLESGIQFWQTDQQTATIRLLRVSADGLLHASQRLITDSHTDQIGGFGGMLIDESMVRSAIRSCCDFAAATYSDMHGPSLALSGRLFIQIAVLRVGHRLLCPDPSNPPSSSSYTEPFGSDPVIVPDSPANSDVEGLTTGSLATHLSDRLVRKFRTNDAYYDPAKSPSIIKPTG